ERRVGMVNLVEAPEEPYAMIGAVPEVGNEVESDDGDRDAEPRGCWRRIQDADAVAPRPPGDSAHARPAYDTEDDEVGEPDTSVHVPTPAQATVWPDRLEQQGERQGRHESRAPQHLELALVHAQRV